MTDRKTAILPLNAALLVVGLADLATTVFWLHTGNAVEINPIMAAILRAGVSLFVAVKVLTLAAYVLVMEWYRRRRSAAFARLVSRVAFSGYLAIYAVSFVLVNGGMLLG